MRAKEPVSTAFEIFLVDQEVVFLGEGPHSFSMTAEAARLTLLRLANALHALRTSAATGADGSSPVVLLVEDEMLVRELGATALEAAGYAVLKAASADQALDLLETGARVHLLFTDIQMPGELDGLQLARLVTDRWPDVRVLLSSGNEIPNPEAMPPNGRFLPKPYDLQDMLKHVVDLIEA